MKLYHRNISNIGFEYLLIRNKYIINYAFCVKHTNLKLKDNTWIEITNPLTNYLESILILEYK